MILLAGLAGFWFVPKHFGNSVDPAVVDHINVFDGDTAVGFTIDAPDEIKQIVENIQNTPITSNYNNQFTYENKVKQYSNNVISTSNNQQEVSFSGNFQKPTTSILEKILEPFKQYIAINSITKNIDDITSVSKIILKERAKQIERARQEAEAAAKEAAKQLRMAQYKNKVFSTVSAGKPVYR